MHGLSVGVFRHSLRVSGFKMYNPEGFSKSALIDLPKAAVDYDLFSLLKGKLRLTRLDIELHEVLIEKNREGKLNVDSLKIAEEEEKKAEKKKPAKNQDLQIDLFIIAQAESQQCRFMILI
jgi:hypothetical protein